MSIQNFLVFDSYPEREIFKKRAGIAKVFIAQCFTPEVRTNVVLVSHAVPQPFNDVFTYACKLAFHLNPLKLVKIMKTSIEHYREIFPATSLWA